MEILFPKSNFIKIYYHKSSGYYYGIMLNRWRRHVAYYCATNACELVPPLYEIQLFSQSSSFRIVLEFLIVFKNSSGI